jgi:hypothetical protein
MISLEPRHWAKLIGILVMLPTINAAFKESDGGAARQWRRFGISLLRDMLVYASLMAAVLGITWVLYRDGGYQKGAAFQVGTGVAFLFVVSFRPASLWYPSGPPKPDAWLTPVRLGALLGVTGILLVVAGLLNLTPLPM